MTDSNLQSDGLQVGVSMSSIVTAVVRLDPATWVKNNTGNTLIVTHLDANGNPVDLTGASVQLEYYINSEPPIAFKDMAIATDPKTGVSSYTFGSVIDPFGNQVYDLYASGVLYWRTIVNIGTSVISVPLWQYISVVDAIPT